MTKKLWFLCYEDKFGNIDMNQLFGGYKTKEEAEAELKRITDKYKSCGFVIRQLDSKLCQTFVQS